MKELWERSVMTMTTNAEVAKGWIALNEKIRRAGDSLARGVTVYVECHNIAVLYQFLSFNSANYSQRLFRS